MDLDAMLIHYFGTADLDTIDEAGFVAGVERARVSFGTERDPGRRFAIWTFLHALDEAPDPATAFKHAGERKAAEDYAWAASRIGRR
jgi:hypothetical protein